MESVEDWIASHCDSILIVNDGGRRIEVDGMTVIALDPGRGFDTGFALETYHPRNVLAFEADDDTVATILGCMTVERLFHVGTGPFASEAQWKSTRSNFGMLYERSNDTP